MPEQLVVRPAHHGLRPHVERYWGYEHHAPAGRQREPLSTGVVLIFPLDAPLGIVDPDRPARAAEWLGPFVGGMDDRCPVIEHRGEMRGVQVDLSPLAARMIFRVSMHSLAREVVTLEDVLGPEGRLLDERLHETASWEQRFGLVDALLARKLGEAEPPPADAAWAWRRLVASRGRLRIGALAAELGCSRKHLDARFREHVGLPPKLVARMLRFRSASDLIVEGAGIGETAAHCGYYDQSHLTREFREFAGTTPTAYASERVAFVQDRGPQPS